MRQEVPKNRVFHLEVTEDLIPGWIDAQSVVEINPARGIRNGDAVLASTDGGKTWRLGRAEVQRGRLPAFGTSEPKSMGESPLWYRICGVIRR